MKTKTFFWSLSFMGLVTAGCQLDLDDIFGNNSINEEFPNVDKALWPYFHRFEEEAATRSIDVDLNEAYITGLISDISTTHVLGQCSYSSNNPHQVTIDKPFWNTASDLAKEFVVFHELGHCYLARLHDESKDSKGVCLSMMRSGTGDCRDNYNTTTRAVLINELFGEKD
ncbi:MAG: hypothetical protein SH818_09585 [Saprospiraceae bacterium]|nr:hypothetical protein [Saprospiraceae bacterium]